MRGAAIIAGINAVLWVEFGRRCLSHSRIPCRVPGRTSRTAGRATDATVQRRAGLARPLCHSQRSDRPDVLDNRRELRSRDATRRTRWSCAHLSMQVAETSHAARSRLCSPEPLGARPRDASSSRPGSVSQRCARNAPCRRLCRRTRPSLGRDLARRNENLARGWAEV